MRPAAASSCGFSLRRRLAASPHGEVQCNAKALRACSAHKVSDMVQPLAPTHDQANTSIKALCDLEANTCPQNGMLQALSDGELGKRRGRGAARQRLQALGDGASNKAVMLSAASAAIMMMQPLCAEAEMLSPWPPSMPYDHSVSTTSSSAGSGIRVAYAPALGDTSVGAQQQYDQEYAYEGTEAAPVARVQKAASVEKQRNEALFDAAISGPVAAACYLYPRSLVQGQSAKVLTGAKAAVEKGKTTAAAEEQLSVLATQQIVFAIVGIIPLRTFWNQILILFRSLLTS